MKQVYDFGMIKFRNIFETVTKCSIKDFIQKENLITIIVNKGEIGKAIGKKGLNIKELEQKFKKRIKIVEFDDNVEKFIKNMLSPIKIKNIDVNDKEIILNVQGFREKGQIIGRDKKNLEEFKKIISKYFNINEIKVI